MTFRQKSKERARPLQHALSLSDHDVDLYHTFMGEILCAFGVSLDTALDASDISLAIRFIDNGVDGGVEDPSQFLTCAYQAFLGMDVGLPTLTKIGISYKLKKHEKTLHALKKSVESELQATTAKAYFTAKQQEARYSGRLIREVCERKGEERGEQFFLSSLEPLCCAGQAFDDFKNRAEDSAQTQIPLGKRYLLRNAAALLSHSPLLLHSSTWTIIQSYRELTAKTI